MRSCRLPFLLGLLWIVPAISKAQLTVYQDRRGQVYTTFDEYGPGVINTTAYKKQVYAGSPFLTYPIWQPGRIRLDDRGKDVRCEIAYNLVENVVMCRFPGDSTAQRFRPERFTVGSDEFVRQQNQQAGIDYKIYAKALYNGRTKLLVNLSKRLEGRVRETSNNGYNGYEKEADVNGRYVQEEKYYIRKGDARPEQISLTKNAVLAALYEQADKLAPRLTRRHVLPADIIAVLPYYDSLMVAGWDTQSVPVSEASYVQAKAPLRNDPVFTQTLHQHMTYPEMAWTQAVYGRVYAGFEIDQRGRVKNVVVLSPANIGMGFVEAVRNGLEKMPDLGPSFAGVYALPVAFTYTNRNESETHTPVNRLPADRLAGRTLLDEFVVPVVVNKPVQTSREVWGYFN